MNQAEYTRLHLAKQLLTKINKMEADNEKLKAEKKSDEDKYAAIMCGVSK